MAKAKGTFGSIIEVRRRRMRWPRALGAVSRELGAVALALVSLMVAPSGSASGSPSSPNHLLAGETLGVGEKLVSPKGRFVLSMQEDGNLVEYRQGNPVWATNTSVMPGSVLQMQFDGNMVLYGPGHVAVWESRTSSTAGYQIEIQDDGNLVIYTQDHQVAIWAAGAREYSVPTPGLDAAPISYTCSIESWWIHKVDVVFAGDGLFTIHVIPTGKSRFGFAFWTVSDNLWADVLRCYSWIAVEPSATSLRQQLDCHVLGGWIPGEIGAGDSYDLESWRPNFTGGRDDLVKLANGAGCNW